MRVDWGLLGAGMFYAIVMMVSCAAMEAFTWAFHRYVMHGPGWGWHKSHHEPGHEGVEQNDWFAVTFAVPAIAAIAAGWFVPGYELMLPIGAGIALYGVLYFLIHDVVTHGRLGRVSRPKTGYIARLVEAHHLHHVTRGRDGGVAFGFLYVPPVAVLRARLSRQRRAPE